MKLSTRWNIVPGDTLADKLTFLEKSGYKYIDLSGPVLDVSSDELVKVFASRSIKVGTVDLLHSVLSADEEARQRRTKLTNQYFDSKLATTSTIRNWKTVLNLLELTRMV